MTGEDAKLKKIAKIVNYLVVRKNKPFLQAASAVFDKYGVPKMEHTHNCIDLRGMYLSKIPFMMVSMQK